MNTLDSLFDRFFGKATQPIQSENNVCLLDSAEELRKIIHGDGA
jgi:hypothetical protein